jgi:hypothetical protein
VKTTHNQITKTFILIEGYRGETAGQVITLQMRKITFRQNHKGGTVKTTFKNILHFIIYVLEILYYSN